MSIDKEELKRMMRANGGRLPPGVAMPGAGVPPGMKALGQPQLREQIVQEPDGSLTKLPAVMTTLFGDFPIQQLMAVIANSNWFERLFQNCKRVIERDAKHIKKGQRPSEWDLKAVAGHLIDEANEVYLSCENVVGADGKTALQLNPDELADVLVLVYMLTIRSGMFLEDLHRRAQLKLEERFEFDDELSEQTRQLGIKTGEFISPEQAAAMKEQAEKEKEQAEKDALAQKDETPV